MLIGYGLPPQSVALSGGTWLTGDGGAALFDGKPARRARIARSGALAINITMDQAIVPGIIAVLGTNLPPGTVVRAAGAQAQTLRLPDGSVCAWLFPTSNALLSSVAVEIDTVVTNVDIGEIAVFAAVDVGIKDGWVVAHVDGSIHNRTKGGQLNTVPGPTYRRLTATLSGRPTEIARKSGLAGMDWESIAVAMAGRRRACVVPQYRDIATKEFDPVLAARAAIYGYATQLPSVENISRQYFTGYLEFEEIPS
jgi:hypothetical protein